MNTNLVVFSLRFAAAAALGCWVCILPNRTLADSCIAPPNGLVAWWPGDGNVLDDTGGDNGIATAGTAFAPGETGQAFGFDGGTNFVQLSANQFPFPLSGTSTTPFSFELWFKTTSGGVVLGQQGTIPFQYSGGHVPAIYIGTDNELRVEMFWTGGASPITITNNVCDGSFHHLAVVYDGSTEMVYLDGVPAGSQPWMQSGWAPSYGATNYNYQLGTGLTDGWPGGNGGWFSFNGLIDEPSLYNRALSSNEVAAIHAAGSAGKCKTLTITVQPQSMLVASGLPAVFPVSAAGTPPLGYQWLYSGTNLTDSARISGSQSNRLTISNALISDGGTYQFVVTNAVEVLTSAPAELTVLAPSPVVWADWTSATVANPGGSAIGTLNFGGTTVNVTYSGEVFLTTQTNGPGTDYYVPISTYTSVEVTNPPVSGMITSAGSSTTNTLRFSPPLPYPILALVSQGSPGIEVDTTFSVPFRILNSGPGWWGAGPALTQSGNILHGVESDGLIQFNGIISSISWTVTPGDGYYSGLTVGAYAPLLLSLNIQLAHGAGGEGDGVVLSWGNPACLIEAIALQTATNVAGPYTTISGATSPYTNGITSQQRFYRLLAN